jgi:hypothetical protein
VSIVVISRPSPISCGPPPGHAFLLHRLASGEGIAKRKIRETRPRVPRQAIPERKPECGPKLPEGDGLPAIGRSPSGTPIRGPFQRARLYAPASANPTLGVGMLTRRTAVVLSISLLALAIPVTALADHAWGPYHWARTRNPFTITLGDNVSSKWDTHLRTASRDWTKSGVLDAPVAAGSANRRSCKPDTGDVEICNAAYGYNNWLGLATISVRGVHITSGSVKVNDSYFNTATYNTSAWRQSVMCQEVGHVFGLDHQDEDFDNPNLGTCMDYTSDPSTNQHPNAHDFAQLERIYSHVDGTTTIGASANTRDGATAGRRAWGRAIRYSDDGRPSVFVRQTKHGRVFTFVIWAA